MNFNQDLRNRTPNYAPNEYNRIGDPPENDNNFSDFVRNNNNRYRTIGWFERGALWFLTIGLVFGLTVLGIYVGLDRDPTGFIAVSKFGVSHLTASVSTGHGTHPVTQQLTDGTELYVSVCTDVAPNPGEIEFKGRTVISYNCPEPKNACEVVNCNSTTGRCHPGIIEGGECAFDTDCNVGDACNIDVCMCQALPNSTTGCTQDSDCTIVSDRGSCVENICNLDGVCEEVILGDGVCWFDGQCNSDTEFCNQDICNCEARPIQQCTMNSDCTDISDRGMCVTNLCLNGTCSETTLGQCWFDGQCDVGSEICDPTTCTCISATAEQCEVDSDCLNIEDRGICASNLCINNTCVETILGLGECWFDGQCNPGSQICNQTTCGCDLAPLNQCQQNNDCTDVSDRGSCVENVCTDGVCIETVLGAGECWFDGQCTVTGESCNQDTCACEPTPTPQCSLDIQCNNVTDRGVCVEYQCINNRCTETVLGLGECWFSGQCPVGQVCDTATCGCVAISDTCVTGYDIRLLPPPVTTLNLVCGYDITLWGNATTYVCQDDGPGATDVYVLELFLRDSTGTWFWVDETQAPIFTDGLSPFGTAAVDSFDPLVVFVGKDILLPQPQAPVMAVYTVFANALQLLDTNFIPPDSTLIVDICIYERTIVVVSDDVYIFEEIAADDWNITQTIDVTGTPIKCSIWEDGLVISLERDPTGDSYLNFINDMGTWMLINNGTTTSLDGSWQSVIIDTNDSSIISNTVPYLVYSSPIEFPFSLIDTATINGTVLTGDYFNAPTGPGIANSFSRNALISDVLFQDSISDAISFQTKFPGGAVSANDLWFADVAFIVEESSEFLAYANYCPIEA